MTKFGAIKQVIDGITFASTAEANRYSQLKLLERAREIKALAVHPKFPLHVSDVLIGVYTADFIYYEGGRQIVEDVKGVVTPEASLRMRVFMAIYKNHELRIVDSRGGWEKFKQRAVGQRVAA